MFQILLFDRILQAQYPAAPVAYMSDSNMHSSAALLLFPSWLHLQDQDLLVPVFLQIHSFAEHSIAITSKPDSLSCCVRSYLSLEPRVSALHPSYCLFFHLPPLLDSLQSSCVFHGYRLSFCFTLAFRAGLLFPPVHPSPVLG